MKTLFEKSQAKQRAYSLPKGSSAFDVFHPPQKLLRKSDVGLPEISELDLTRHFSSLAKRNMGIDTNFYPLGSCTMKLNPRINEQCAYLPGFAKTHPFAPDYLVQGNLEVIFSLIDMLCQITGMDAGSLTSNAGAQGEFVGVKMMAAYHRKNGETERNEMLIPDNAHGTNPATAAMAGFKTIVIPSNSEGDLDINHLRKVVSSKTAGLMLTNPNTLGLFSSKIKEIADIIHQAGGLMYCDGANLNAILNIAKVSDMGFDVMHINLHKTFSTPHGGGGPGSGPVLCNKKLADFLPVPRVLKENGKYRVVWDSKNSIGQISTFFGNFGIYLRAFLYMKLHGHFGMRRISEIAVLNANYLRQKMKQFFDLPFDRYCMHEFVIQADKYLEKGIKALDIAKRLLDYGIYAPTIYFPLIVREAMLVEPTESESKATLDYFVEVMAQIIQEIETNPSLLKEAPKTLSVTRLNEVLAAKNLILKHSLPVEG